MTGTTSDRTGQERACLLFAGVFAQFNAQLWEYEAEKIQDRLPGPLNREDECCPVGAAQAFLRSSTPKVKL